MKMAWNQSINFALATLVAAFCPTHTAKAQEAPVASEPAIDITLPATDDEMAGAGPVRRYDWFHNVWKRRRTNFASRVQSDQGAVVFFGDSITQGWGDGFRGQFLSLIHI